MKIRTVVISVVVSASLVCGAGYGAYYAMKGKESPVEVVPVMNVNNTFWDESSVYGSVTSQVSQIVNLKEEYQIEDIFVKAGDEVKTGDPLFSYDMTLQELELEMEKLTLQTSELEMVRLEKELEKLKNTRATASLEANDMVRTAEAEEPEILENGEEPGEQAGTEAPVAQTGTDSIPALEAGDENGNGEPAGDGKEKENTGDTGIIDKIEVQDGKVPDGAAASGEEERQEQERLALITGIGNYETLLTGIGGLFQNYGEKLNAAEIGPAVKEAVSYYRKNLAEEQTAEETDENGGLVQIRKYVLKDSVKSVLDETEVENLEKYAEQMEKYHGSYVKLLIRELDPENPGDFNMLLAEARSEYNTLSRAAQKEVDNLSRLEELEKAAENGELSKGETLPSEPVESESGTDSSEAPGAGEPTESEQDTNTGETAGNTEQGTESETPSGTTVLTESDAESSESTGSTESDTGSGDPAPGITPAESETDTQGNSETQTESETELRYILKVTGGFIEVADQNLESESFPAGALVTVAAEESDLQSFQEWSWVTASGVELEIEDPTSARITFPMPESDVELTAAFLSNEEKLQNAIDAFHSLADEALGVIGTQKEGYDADALETALRFYQENLAQQSADIADGSGAVMEDYELRQIVVDYLTAREKAHEIENLAERYKELCFTFVKTLVSNLDPQNLTREEFSRAKAAYDTLGLGWQEELDNSVYDGMNEGGNTAVPEGMMSANGQTADVSAQTGMEGQEPQSESGESTGETGRSYSTVILTYGEKLEACEVILMIREIDVNQPETLLIPALEQVRDAYLALNAAQRSIVWNGEYLIELLRKYNLWQEETEPVPDTEFPGGDGFDDFGGDDSGYTAAELKELIEEAERAIKECSLDIRENELSVKQKQRVVDEKVVKSTLDGTVITIGTKDGNSENSDYFLKVSNETGLYAKGVMNELAFNTLKIGDTISGTSMTSGTSFTAVITEISEYPDPNGASMSWGFGSENTNASYYPFYARIDNTEGLEEGEAELKLQAPSNSDEDDIYLGKFMVRTGSDGKSYVYKRGEDGKLTKQYVTLGKTIYSYAVQIMDGLALTDEIAFPYGKNVHEGAATKQVDMLEDAYM